MSEHTPGPWQAVHQLETPDWNHGYSVCATQNFVCLKCMTGEGHSMSECTEPEFEKDGLFRKYDALLIAAAPDLLAACKGLLAAWSCTDPAKRHEYRSSAIGHIRTAVAKAQP